MISMEVDEAVDPTILESGPEPKSSWLPRYPIASILGLHTLIFVLTHNGYHVHKPCVWALEWQIKRLSEVNLLRYLIYLDIKCLFHGSCSCVSYLLPLSHQCDSSPKVCPHLPSYSPSKFLSNQTNHRTLWAFIYSYLRIVLFSPQIR